MGGFDAVVIAMRWLEDDLRLITMSGIYFVAQSKWREAYKCDRSFWQNHSQNHRKLPESLFLHSDIEGQPDRTFAFAVASIAQFRISEHVNQSAAGYCFCGPSWAA